ncbi:dolichyl-phosphate beta-glucosyltransferase [Tritrichomonas musculus]|uniref:dolichyl-phosphate beta-glucosyltransferase n=1 Tax=Tritrichomonas musculus TaxID=1915356 RepID=A0ABR2HXF6_9EUKA
MQPDKLADLINLGLIILLIISFFYVLFDRFVSDETLYDLTTLPPSDPRKLTYYVEPIKNLNDPKLFPSVFDPPDLYLSLVVPAYNEEKRIPSMLEETVEYLTSRQMNNNEFTWEIIVVDDGSHDRTAEYVINFNAQHPEVILLRQPFNMGKGAAVQAGALHSRGRLILMVDADGATKISEIEALEKKILDLMKIKKAAVAVGSRASVDEIEDFDNLQPVPGSSLMPEDDFSFEGNIDEQYVQNESKSKAHRTPIRQFLGLAFHLLVVFSGVKGIQDTQCGFKMFSREAARWLFPNQHIKRWCFDPELLVIAARKNMMIAEIPVEWNEIPGSNIKISSMIKMAIDLIQIAVYYRVGLWTIRKRSIRRM